MTARHTVLAGRILLLLGILAAWQWGHWALGDLFVPSLLAVLQRLYAVIVGGEIFGHLAITAEAAGLGFAIGTVCGVLLSVALRLSSRLALAIEPYVMTSMGIPLFALAPLLILWFGINMAPKVVIGAAMVFYIIFIAVFAGLRAVDGRLITMARVMGAAPLQIVRKVYWPGIQPYLFAGLKLALPRALGATIVGEFLVGDRGLGFYIENARQQADTVGVFTGIVIVTVVVLGTDMLLERLQARSLAWRPIDRDMVA
ncbi:ABC transporter permease [Vineibacter terrae]|uniref:ABC transporter permease n=1 Tax=Vineibacter terrae TaxID=2586908 RepID=UPI002E3789C9|nr:ABC transporter permease [Vineibacter terrae]HEX2888021.1 ABC transporter permease [Vineibacter terrae]